MKLWSSLLLCIAAGTILVACHNNAPHDKEESGELKSATPAPAITFNQPTLIFITSNPKDFNPETADIKQFILHAEELGINITITPPADFTFILNGKGKSTMALNSLADGEMIFFNGKELLITHPENSSLRAFNVFYENLTLHGTNTNTNNLAFQSKRDQKTLFSPENPDEINTEYMVSYPSDAVTGEFNERSSKLQRLASVPVNQQTTSVLPVIVRNPAQESYISTAKGLNIKLDNDIFSYTDRYYTNGVDISFYSPALAFWRINNILPVSTKHSMEYNTIHLKHEMYTPYTTKVPPLLEDDRPYASALYLRFSRVAEVPDQGVTQEASLDIGVIGEAALGSLFQKGVHAGLPTNDEPLGWETQINNDIVLNYNYRLLRQLISYRNLHTFSIVSASLGTLNTFIESGVGFRTGSGRHYLRPLPGAVTNKEDLRSPHWNFAFESNFTSRIVGNNATLTGGILNKNNIYVLKPEEIERLLFMAEARFTASYSRYGISIAQYYLSKEFNEGKSHFWGQIGLNIGF